jgi:hypothetical protein
MAETVSQFVNELAQLGEALSDPQELLAEIGDQVVQTMKLNVPVDTGALRSSISWSFNGSNSIEFNMLEYGLYQNYGVLPNYNTQSYHKPFSNDFGGITNPQPSPNFGMGSGYRNRAFGLPARKFYDELIIQEYIGEQFLEEITIDF